MKQRLGMATVLGALAVIAALAAVTTHFQRSAQSHSPPPPTARDETPSRTPALPAARERSPAPVESEAEEEQPPDPPSVDYDWRRTLRDTKAPPKLPREVVEAFLEKRQRSAESLLAAYRALDDTNLLAEAASRFPNDPRVQRSVLSRDLFPEDRRKRLELFKASAPDNALANYLSAQEHMSNRYQEGTGQWLFGPDKLPLQDYLQTASAQAAINELAEATSKPLFENYVLEARLDEEELNLFAGRSVLQARLGASGWSSDLMPELANFKSIAICLQQLEKTYLGAGDTASAQNLAQIGLTLANRLRSGESGKLIIDQLVSTASEAIHLNAWDANTSYEFLGGKTPAERQAEMKRERATLRALTEGVREQLPALSEADVLSYLDRQRAYGEADAMRWLLQRTQATVTPVPLP